MKSKTAWIALRPGLERRREAFASGLQRHGYRVEFALPEHPKAPDDLLVVWNRYGHAERVARHFENRGNTVLVAENAAWGKEFLGDSWYSLAVSWHNTAGCAPYIPGRWESLGIEPQPWRKPGGETVILPQRGIGPEGRKMPLGWADKAAAQYKGRVRRHPGNRPAKPLEDDLRHASRVVTWGSGAAVKALMWGIPVVSEMPNWIAQQTNTDSSRLAMFRQLACAQWRVSEIANGDPFRWLL